MIKLSTIRKYIVVFAAFNLYTATTAYASDLNLETASSEIISSNGIRFSGLTYKSNLYTVDVYLDVTNQAWSLENIPVSSEILDLKTGYALVTDSNQVRFREVAYLNTLYNATIRLNLDGTWSLLEAEAVTPETFSGSHNDIQEVIYANKNDSDVLKGVKPLKVRTWPRGIIPYDIQSGIDPNTLANIQQAIAHLHQNTAIRLIRTDETGEIGLSVTNYIEFRDHPSSCNSIVGMAGGQQIINLMSPTASNTCNEQFGTVVHEILHAAGFLHEQVNPDGKSSVSVRADRIQTGTEHNFFNSFAVSTTSYDIKSIMNYGAFSFSICSDNNDIKWETTSINSGCRPQNGTTPWFNRVVDTNVICRIECATILYNGNTYSANRSRLSDLDIISINNTYPIPTAINRVFLKLYGRTASAADINFNASGIESGALTENGLLENLAIMEIENLFSELYNRAPSTEEKNSYLAMIIEDGKTIEQVKGNLLAYRITPILFDLLQ